MGIINDFFMVNSNIEEFLKEKKFLVKKIKEYKLKNNLYSSINKLRKSNVPMDKENIYELSSNIYSAFADHKYKNLKITFYPNSQIFKGELLDIKLDNVKDVSYVIMTKSKIISISITVTDTRVKNKIVQELSHTYNFEANTFSTNIKEIENEIAYCNSELYKIMADFIEFILKN